MFSILILVSSGEASDNVSVWQVGIDGVFSKLAAWSHRQQASWGVQWTQDESHWARMQPADKNGKGGEVLFYKALEPKRNPSGSVINSFRIAVDHLGDFALSPGAYPKAALFIREASGQPAAIRIYLLPNGSQPIAQKRFYRADRAQLCWSPTGKHLLAVTHTEMDATGNSYYGETALYFLAGDGSADFRVPLEKEGPVHEVCWSPRGDEFMASYGFMPKSQVTLFDLKCDPVQTLPTDTGINHVRYSPDGQLILLGGFGNLPGRIEVWSRPQMRRIACFQAPGASVCEWSPSSRTILTAIQSPRLRVDNQWKLWSWRGSELQVKPFNELYQVAWLPMPHHTFTPVNIDQIPQGTAPPAPVKREAYRPPGLRNSPVQAVKSDPKPALKAPSATPVTKEERAVKKLREKMDQIRELKQRMAEGEVLELNQLEKIQRESQVEAELMEALKQLNIKK